MTGSAFLSRRLCGIYLAALCVSLLSLLGCGANVPASSPLVGGQLRGNLHGGQQPVSGASIQLYAAGTSGYGAGAEALLTTPVMSDGGGNFSITEAYTCPSSTSQLYLVAKGGNPGLGPGTDNEALALMAAVGPCSLHGGQYTLDPNAFVNIDEVTTVASVYALAAFVAPDGVQIGATSGNATGLANAFLSVNNLANTTTGAALAKTPAGNGTVPQAEINTLADIISPCVNSDGTGAPCSKLFAATTPSGGAAPINTIQAVLDIAMHPANEVSTLYALSVPGAPFQPTLSSVPNDWTVGVTYTGGLKNPQGMAIDGSGNVWIANNGTAPNTSSITELSNNGTILSGPNGYTGGGMSFALGIAIDPSGNAWVAAYGNSNVIKLSSSGAILSGPNGFTGGGLNFPASIAIDGTGNAWVPDSGSDSVIKLSNSGTILSGSSGFTAGGLTTPSTIAIDSAGDAWVVAGANTVIKLSNSGTVLSGSSGYPVRGGFPAIDAEGDVWLTGGLLNAVFELSNSGSLLSPTAGYPTCVSPFPVPEPGRGCDTSFVFGETAIDGSGNVWTGTGNDFYDGLGHIIARTFGMAELNHSGTIISGPSGYVPTGITAIVIDGSGNVWTNNAAGNNVMELIGVATPVVTPLSVAVKNGTLGSRP